MPRNIKLTLAYDGSPYSGWQIQPGRATVQGTLAEAIGRLTGEKVLPQGSGRTDTGVHALAQVASFCTGNPMPPENLQRALNDILPLSIRITAAEEVSPEFHARHSAKAKTYRYRLYRGAVCPPFIATQVYYHPYPLDEDAMMEVAKEVVGEHDFTSFAAVDPERANEQDGVTPNNIRRIFKSAFTREADELIYEVRGNGFLHHMVRNLVGTFLLVGKGTLKPAEMQRILQAKNRSANPGATTPPEGLYLVAVEY